uniref:(northern house mosquito) hypothetical protein n=1 Tax=Culex pipiens TaxID=7175 RepID=A0A8D8AIJ5_CULPI
MLRQDELAGGGLQRHNDPDRDRRRPRFSRIVQNAPHRHVDVDLGRPEGRQPAARPTSRARQHRNARLAAEPHQTGRNLRRGPGRAMARRSLKQAEQPRTSLAVPQDSARAVPHASDPRQRTRRHRVQFERVTQLQPQFLHSGRLVRTGSRPTRHLPKSQTGRPTPPR